MKNFKNFLIAALLALASVTGAFAQNSFTVTTLSSAITSTSATQFVVASATGFTANTTSAYIDGELIQVLAVNGTTITGRRGASGTRATTHASSSIVRVGNNIYFGGYDKNLGSSCTAANEVILPWVNVVTGNYFYCASSVWRRFTPNSVNGAYGMTTVTTKTTAGAVTYTAAEILGGLIKRDPNGAGRSDVTPTATLLIAAMPGAKVGDSFVFTIVNDADAAETITLTAGTGVTLSGTMTIAQSNAKAFQVVITGVATPAATVYSLGTVVN